MSNVGFTQISATGAAEDLGAMLAAVRATATDKLDFCIGTLDGSGDDVTVRYVRSAKVRQDDRHVHLSINMVHDLDCLWLGQAISRSYPVLKVLGYFEAEVDEGAFIQAGFSAGTTLYRARFEDEHEYCLKVDDADHPHRHQRRWFFKRTQAHVLAYDDLRPAQTLGLLLGRDACAGAWRRSDACYAGHITFLQPSGPGEPECALVMAGGDIILLHDLDRYGGYDTCETMMLDQALVRFPELAAMLNKNKTQYDAEKRANELRWNARPASTAPFGSGEIAF